MEVFTEIDILKEIQKAFNMKSEITGPIRFGKVHRFQVGYFNIDYKPSEDDEYTPEQVIKVDLYLYCLFNQNSTPKNFVRFNFLVQITNHKGIFDLGYDLAYKEVYGLSDLEFHSDSKDYIIKQGIDYLNKIMNNMKKIREGCIWATETTELGYS